MAFDLPSPGDNTAIFSNPNSVIIIWAVRRAIVLEDGDKKKRFGAMSDSPGDPELGIKIGKEDLSPAKVKTSFSNSGPIIPIMFRSEWSDFTICKVFTPSPFESKTRNRMECTEDISSR